MDAYLHGGYGLTIQAPLPLPELPAAVGPADVTVRFGAGGAPDWGIEAAGYGQRLDQDGARLFWKETGHFLVSRGAEIVIDPAPGADVRFIRAALLGPVLAALLHQRDFVLLHARGIAVNGGAVAFLADSGEGKSTTAAAFHRRGYPVIADDLVAVRTSTRPPEVEVGFPQLKLLPDALIGLGEDPLELPRVYEGDEKRRRQVHGPDQPDPLPVHALYLLSSGDALEIETLGAAAAMKALARHTFASGLLGPEGLRSHFRQCAWLAELGVVRRLSRPRDLDGLNHLVQAVEADLLARS
ncbi:MAG: hypothetical protein ACO1SX_18480 [Actinomycetota bacterium]